MHRPAVEIVSKTQAASTPVDFIIQQAAAIIPANRWGRTRPTYPAINMCIEILLNVRKLSITHRCIKQTTMNRATEEMCVSQVTSRAREFVKSAIKTNRLPSGALTLRRTCAVYRLVGGSADRVSWESWWLPFWPAERSEKEHRLRNPARSKPPTEWEGGGDTGGFKTRPRPFDERLRNGRLRPHDCRDSDDDAPFLSYRSHTTMYSF